MFAESYAKVYDVLNSEKKYRQEMIFLNEWAEKPKSMLDLGCGTASYWEWLPKKLFLKGIEISRAMINASNYHEMIEQGDITQMEYRGQKYDLVTALFDVVNYIPEHYWWENLPVKKEKFFIFDCWDALRVKRDGFRKTIREFNGIRRTITPLPVADKSIALEIKVEKEGCETQKEIHQCFIHTLEDIQKYCGDKFEIVSSRRTKTWQTWYKLKRK